MSENKGFLSLEELTRPEMETEEVELTGLGKVRIQSLSREDVVRVAKMEPLQVDQYTISRGLVEPKMTEGQVAAWQKVAKGGGAFKELSDAIGELSGLGNKPVKGAIKSTGDDAEPAV